MTDGTQRMVSSDAVPTSDPAAQAVSAPVAPLWRRLLWCEWFVHSRLVLYFLFGWLACVWFLPALMHPGWILAFGAVYAIVAGPLFGGNDLITGGEEFTLALPVRRSALFRARLTVGLGVLLLFTAMDLLALGLDLPQAVARLYLDTGLLKPWRIDAPGLLPGLVLALPLAIFSTAFSLAANARTRAFVLTAWFWGALVALVLLRVGLHYEAWRWQAWNGFVTCPLLVAASAGALCAGHRWFCRKEIAPPTGRIVLPGHWWLWLALGLVGATFLYLLLQSVARDLGRLFA